MNLRLLALPVMLLTVAANAAERPAIPDKPIAVKKDLLFSDNFDRPDLGKAWGPVVPTYTLDHGALMGTQTRVTAPAADGKPAVVGHAAVIGTDIPTKNSVIELRIKFNGATALSAEFDDRKFTGSHYGHICRCIVTKKDVTLRDEKEGSMRNDVYAMGSDPAHKEEKAKLLKGRSVSYPVKLEDDTWYTLIVETVGDEMRATLDGKPVAFLKSPGIAHTTKSKVEFGCAGKDGYFDDVKIWNAEAAKK